MRGGRGVIGGQVLFSPGGPLVPVFPEVGCLLDGYLLVGGRAVTLSSRAVTLSSRAG